MQFITTHYQQEQALKRYYSAIETHTEGRAYKNFIENMSYLNDDFNDKLYHFSTAVERYKIGTGQIKEKIEILRTQCSIGTRIYDVERYSKINIDIKK